MSQQSQAVFVDVIAGWSREECLKNLDTALPTALSKLEDSAYIADGIKILQLICRLFVPCVQIEELEEKIYANMCQIASALVDSSLNKIHLNVKGELKDTEEELREVLTECIQWIVDIGQCLEACLRHVSGERNTVELDTVRSLVTAAVHVLHKSYTHCKESTDVYGSLVEDLSEPLTAVYRQAHSLQMALLNVVDKVQRSGPALEAHVQVLTSVCEGLFEICSLVSSLDVKLAISLWRGISRLCNQQLSLLRDRLEVCPMINFLCDQVTSGYHYLFQLCGPPDPDSLSQGDDKAFSKSLKLVSFQMKVLVALLRDFCDYLGECEGAVMGLMVCLLKRLPPSLSAASLAPKQESELRVQVASAASPILRHLLANRAFRAELVKKQTDRPEDEHLPVLLLQLMVLDVLPKSEGEVQDFWLSPSHNDTEQASVTILEAVFESVNLCWLEMRVPVMLPGVMAAGKPQSDVCLFEFVATHLCGFIGACLSQQFSHLEEVLLHNTLHGDHMTYLLAVDCWCFMVRYGTASVCNDQVMSLLAMRTRLERKKGGKALRLIGRVDVLVARLVNFMAPKDQASLVTQYPPPQHQSLWSSLLTRVSSEVRPGVKQDLVSWALKEVGDGHGTLDKMLTAMASLESVLKANTDASCDLAPKQILDIKDATSKMWLHLQPKNSNLSILPPHFFQLIKLTDSLVAILNPRVVNISLHVMLTLLKTQKNFKNSTDVALAVETLLPSIISNIEESQDNAFDQINLIMKLLSSSDHPLVLHNCFTILKSFSHTSNMPCLMQQCINGNKKLEHLWKDFTSKTSQVDFLYVEYLKEVKNKSNSIDNLEPDATTTVNHLENKESEETDLSGDIDYWPSAKRRREERDSIDCDRNKNDSVNNNSIMTMQNQDYKDIVDNLRSVAEKLEAGQRHPQWFLDDANEYLSRISHSLSGKDWFDSLA